MNAAIQDLHRRMDRRELRQMDELHNAMAGLELERAHLARVPTWPAQPETLTGLVAALVLPVVIWLVQFGLEKLLG